MKTDTRVAEKYDRNLFRTLAKVLWNSFEVSFAFGDMGSASCNTEQHWVVTWLRHCQPLNGFQTSITSSPEQIQYLSCMLAVVCACRPHTKNLL